MAELLGVISACAGIASFLIEVASGLEKVTRTIKYNRNQAASDLQSLSADLGKLQQLVNGLPNSQQDTLVVFAVQRCQQTYTELESGLNKLSQVVDKEKHKGNRGINLRRWLSFTAEEESRESEWQCPASSTGCFCEFQMSVRGPNNNY